MTVIPHLISGTMIQQLADLPAALPALLADAGPPSHDEDAHDLLPAARSYVSADRLRWVLRNRLGCVETPRRDRDATYWLAPDGRRFRVLNPVADPIGRPMVDADGRMGDVYAVCYVRTLLSFLIDG